VRARRRIRPERGLETKLAWTMALYRAAGTARKMAGEREDGSWDSLVAYLLRLPCAEEHVDSVPLFQISVTSCRN
jgi:hypothetical protein